MDRSLLYIVVFAQSPSSFDPIQLKVHFYFIASKPTILSCYMSQFFFLLLDLFHLPLLKTSRGVKNKSEREKSLNKCLEQLVFGKVPLLATSIHTGEEIRSGTPLSNWRALKLMVLGVGDRMARKWDLMCQTSHMKNTNTILITINILYGPSSRLL